MPYIISASSSAVMPAAIALYELANRRRGWSGQVGQKIIGWMLSVLAGDDEPEEAFKERGEFGDNTLFHAIQGLFRVGGEPGHSWQDFDDPRASGSQFAIPEGFFHKGPGWFCA